MTTLSTPSPPGAPKRADAPLEDIARRAGVGIGTLYRHFPTRLDLQAAVFRSQVGAVCGEADALLEQAPPGEAFGAWMRSLAGYLVTKRGLSHALIEAVGVESELISSCWMAMRQTTERLLANAQEALRHHRNRRAMSPSTLTITTSTAAWREMT